MMNEPAYSSSISLPAGEISNCQKLLDGVIDLHLHLAPDILPRACDVIEFLESAEKVGYRAVILKDHYSMSTARAYLMRKIFKRTVSFGGIALNYPVGTEPRRGRGCYPAWCETDMDANFRSGESLGALQR